MKPLVHSRDSRWDQGPSQRKIIREKMGSSHHRPAMHSHYSSLRNPPQCSIQPLGKTIIQIKEAERRKLSWTWFRLLFKAPIKLPQLGRGMQNPFPSAQYRFLLFPRMTKTALNIANTLVPFQVRKTQYRMSPPLLKNMLRFWAVTNANSEIQAESLLGPMVFVLGRIQPRRVKVQQRSIRYGGKYVPIQAKLINIFLTHLSKKPKQIHASRYLKISYRHLTVREHLPPSLLLGQFLFSIDPLHLAHASEDTPRQLQVDIVIFAQGLPRLFGSCNAGTSRSDFVGRRYGEWVWTIFQVLAIAFFEDIKYSPSDFDECIKDWKHSRSFR